MLFKKTKSKPAKKKTTPDDKFFVKQNDDTHYQLDEVLYTRSKLSGFSRLVGDDELRKFIRMRMTIPQIKKRMNKRLMVMLLMIIMSVIAGLIFKKYFLVCIAVGILMAIVTWVMDVSATNTYEQHYDIDRNIAWTTFVQMAAAYLPALKSGANMYSVLKKLVPRMKQQDDKENLERLLIDMRIDPPDPRPFLHFAHLYSTAKSAETIMLVIQSMYLGDVNDHNIQTLALNATTELSAQVDVVIEHKLSKFKQTGTKIVAAFMIPSMSYVLLLAFTAIQGLLKSVHF